MEKKTTTTILVWVLIFIFFSVNLIPKEKILTEDSKYEVLSANFISPVDYIHINDNWSAPASYYDFISGIGTKENPYLIENLVFTKRSPIDSGIIIENTTGHFILRNISLNNVSNSNLFETNASIKLINVSNGKIIDCKFSNNTGFSIFGEYLSHFNITGNIFQNNDKGLYTRWSTYNYLSRNYMKGHIPGSGWNIAFHYGGNHNIVENNILYDGHSGVRFSTNCHNNTARGNYIVNSSDYGVYTWGTFDLLSSNNIIENNTVYKSQSYGINVHYGNNNTIRNNLIFNSSGSGINIFQSGYTEVYGNRIWNNSQYGVKIDSGSHNSSIYGNSFEGTNKWDHAYQQNPGMDNHWNNSVEGNYWNDYTGIDVAPIDEIGDTPYIFTGGQDDLPLMADPTGWREHMPVFITINSPDDVHMEFGSTGNKFIWYSLGVPISSYQLKINNNTEQDQIWLGIFKTVDLDYLETLGEYNFTIITYDIFGVIFQDEVLVVVEDTTSSEINHPLDMSFKVNETAELIDWIAQDYLLDDWEIYRNDSLIASGSWVNNSIKILSFGTMEPGTYIYKIRVTDTSGNWVEDTVLVTVTSSDEDLVVVDDTIPPEINHPVDISFVENETGEKINWIAQDNFLDVWEIFMNGSLISSGSWTNNSISLLVLGSMGPGTYVFKIRVTDTSGNWVEDTVVVTVTPSDVKQDGITSIPGYNSFFLIGVILFSTIILTSKKKKS